jgi:hypothetical protein
MADLDRDYVIEQLEKLGAEDDATVLAAARAVDQHVRESGFAWDDLLEPDYDEDDLDDDRVDEDDIDRDELEGDDDAVLMDGLDEDESIDDLGDDDGDTSGDPGEMGRLIDRLIAHQQVTEDTREDLTEMKADFDTNSLSAMDRRFVRALAKRLGVR